MVEVCVCVCVCVDGCESTEPDNEPLEPYGIPWPVLSSRTPPRPYNVPGHGTKDSTKFPAVAKMQLGIFPAAAAGNSTTRGWNLKNDPELHWVQYLVPRVLALNRAASRTGKHTLP